MDLLAVQGTCKSLLQHHNSKASILWHLAFFIIQLSHPYMTTGKTIALTIQTSVSKVMSLCIEIIHSCNNWKTMIRSDQLLSRVRLFVTPWTIPLQASLSTTNSWSLPKLMSIETMMPSNHLILCHHLLLLSSIFPSIRVFSNESALHIRLPKYWSFSFSISPSSEY